MTTKVDPKHIERIYRAMGYWAQRFIAYPERPPRWWYADKCIETLPDPLTDTPEGDHAWFEIMRWFNALGWLWFKGDSWMVRGPKGEYGEAHGPEKPARLAALASALGEHTE